MLNDRRKTEEHSRLDDLCPIGGQSRNPTNKKAMPYAKPAEIKHGYAARNGNEAVGSHLQEQAGLRRRI